ncbi:MAG: PEGA domain-containing protein [Candidatus Methanospirareceae archaeon]
MGWWEDFKSSLEGALKKVLAPTYWFVVESFAPQSLIAKFMSFILEEALQTATMGLYQLIRLKKYSAAKRYFWKVQDLLTAAKNYQEILSYMEPETAKIWELNLAAVDTQLGGYAEILFGAKEEKEPEKVPAKKTKLVIDSKPDWAKIDIDGEYIHHVTPEEVVVEPGTYKIRIYRKKYHDYETTVTVREGEVKRVYAELVPITEEKPPEEVAPPPVEEVKPPPAEKPQPPVNERYTILDYGTFEWAESAEPRGRKDVFEWDEVVYAWMKARGIPRGQTIEMHWQKLEGETWVTKASTTWTVDKDYDWVYTWTKWQPLDPGEWRVFFRATWSGLCNCYFTIKEREVLPGKAWLKIRTEWPPGKPYNAFIYIDGKPVRWVGSDGVDTFEVSPGEHRITATSHDPAYGDNRVTVSVADGETKEVLISKR